MKKKGNEKIFVYRDEVDFILKKIGELESRNKRVEFTQNRMASDLTPMYIEWISNKQNEGVVDCKEDWVYV